MHPPICPSDLATLIDETDVAARRLRRKLALPSADLDDLRQDLLIDLICRLPSFDKRRGSIGAFAGLVLRNHCSRIAIRHHRQRQVQGGTMLSLDAPIAGSVEPLGCLLAESDGLAAWQGHQSSHHDIFHVQEAVRSALARLPDADRSFCCALADRPVTALAAQGFGSRSSLYRRLADLRHVLTAYGIGPSWDDFATA